jgi:predicted Rossmann fold flavoprotein
MKRVIKGLDTFDVAIVGAGAAGMYCAAQAGARGARVVLIDHAQRLAEKIRISGGGRCNFTNLEGDQIDRYLGDDPLFARFALREYPPAEFIELVRRYRIGFHEKHRGQLFCDTSAEEIIAMLVAECDRAGIEWRRPVAVRSVERAGQGFQLQTDAGSIEARRLVVATGGLPVPKIGATDWGLILAKQFGLTVVEPRPALVPLTFAAQDWTAFVPLAGISLEVGIQVQTKSVDSGTAGAAARRAKPVRFVEDLLFTHRGLSGPAVLQTSSFWRPGDALQVNLLPGQELAKELVQLKSGGRKALSTILAERLPRRLAQDGFEPLTGHPAAVGSNRIADFPDRVLQELSGRIQSWTMTPSGSEGWRKAEVMRGGVSTRELDPRTMESRRIPGLHFIGEVVDITGWLGGYNFQWAWSSAAVCARAMTGSEA